MKKITKLLFAAMMMSMVTVAEENKKDIADMRIFGLEFQQNKQDEHKNTFLHRLALECELLEDWSEVVDKERSFLENNGNWMTNPFIENENGNTARKEAKKVFKRTGNPICGLLVTHFKNKEDVTLGVLALKKQREGNMFLLQLGVKFPEEKHRK